MLMLLKLCDSTIKIFPTWFNFRMWQWWELRADRRVCFGLSWWHIGITELPKHFDVIQLEQPCGSRDDVDPAEWSSSWWTVDCFSARDTRPSFSCEEGSSSCWIGVRCDKVQGCGWMQIGWKPATGMHVAFLFAFHYLSDLAKAIL